MTGVPLGALLARSLEERAADVVLATPNRSLVGEELGERVARIAAWIMGSEPDPNEVIGVSVADEVDHLCATAALLVLGIPSISLPTFEPIARRERVARAAGVRRVVEAPSARFDRAPSLRVLELPQVGRLPAAEALAGLAGAASPLDPAFFRATSGTTGEPKVFGLPSAMVLAAVERIKATEEEACALRTASGEHDGNRLYRMTALLAGRTVPIAPDLEGPELARFCGSAGVTEVSMGTFRLAALLHAATSAEAHLPEGTGILTGASRVPGQMRLATMARLTPRLRVSYATSEVGIISIANGDEHERWPEGVGWPLEHVDVRIRDNQGAELRRGEIGVPWIRKPGVATAGLEREGDWIRIPDLVSWPEDAPLHFHGRADDLITMNGIGIFPAEIEDALTAHPAVLDVAAYGVPSSRHGSIPVAAVVLRPGAQAGEDELLHLARLSLGLRAPRAIIMVEAIPRTSTGKAAARLLPRPD